jgi:hypothetical protein
MERWRALELADAAEAKVAVSVSTIRGTSFPGLEEQISTKLGMKRATPDKIVGVRRRGGEVGEASSTMGQSKGMHPSGGRQGLT